MQVGLLVLVQQQFNTHTHTMAGGLKSQFSSQCAATLIRRDNLV